MLSWNRFHAWHGFKGMEQRFTGHGFTGHGLRHLTRRRENRSLGICELKPEHHVAQIQTACLLCLDAKIYFSLNELYDPKLLDSYGYFSKGRILRSKSDLCF